MGFIFSNPLFLLGLSAAILPILIHRITKKKAVVINFSAVRLLLQSQLITARPQRLKHLFLLALRILAVAAIVLLMARPAVIRPGFAALAGNGAKVLILDNSASMGFHEDRGQRFAIAKSAARELLAGYGGQVFLIPTVPGIPGPAARWMRTEEALAQLDMIPLSFGRSDISGAFGQGYAQLQGLNVPRQLVILSDLARGDWEGIDLTGTGTLTDAEIIFLRIGDPVRDPNLAVHDVRLVEDEIVAGIPSRLEVSVSNFSDIDHSVLVQIFISGLKVDQKSIELEAATAGRVFFDVLVENPGWVNGEVKLTADRLAADDTYYFPLKVSEKVKVMVVDGTPTTSLKDSESYFVVSALQAGGSEGSPFLSSIITENEMFRVDPKNTDVLFLLNVARPDFSRVASFLEAGKPVFLFLGDQIVPAAYNKFSLAPWQIQERVDLRDSVEKSTRIESIDAGLKFFAPLEKSMRKAAVQTYYNIEGNAKYLLTLKSRHPLLVTDARGKSKFFMFTSSADLDWNDFPLHASYLPFIQGLVKQAVGLSAASLPDRVPVGEPFPEQGRPFQLAGPRGGPGIFQFPLAIGEMRRGVNVPFEESNLVKLGDHELKKKFGTMAVQVIEYQEKKIKDHQGGRKELWPTILVFLFGVLAVEMMVANGGFHLLRY
ncbi:MAG: BatA and WFA domain-containing protein [Desulfobacterales bacterium]|nr:BatA and WFA domain-containing protein [Desulfobacterales bacterium]